MNRLVRFFLPAWGLVAAVVVCAETMELDWPTSHAAPPVTLAPAQAEWLPAFRASLELLPESVIVSLALAQPQVLGLPPAEAGKLAPLLAARYEAIARDPDFASARSHLGYCFSAVRPTRGLARLTVPAAADASTPVLLFLHGQGGSFLWYHHWLKTAFPNHIILSPAYGTAPASIPPAYLEECLRAAEARLGHRLEKPALVGLSAGGFGALRACAIAPALYRRTVVLAAYVPPDLGQTLWRGSQLRLLAGSDEYFVQDGTWARGLVLLRRNGASVDADTVPGAKHFFLATHPDETRARLNRALR